MAVGDRPVRSAILYGESGIPWLVNGAGIQYAGGLREAIGQGLVPGGVVGSATGRGDLAAIATVVLRASAYTEPADGLAVAREVVSSSANDTNSGGTGARKVKITYFNADLTQRNTVELNLAGTTPVATPAMRFVEKIVVSEVGSNGANAGNITLRVASGGAAIGVIPTSEGTTYWAHHYVCAGKTCFIDRISLATSAIATQLFMRRQSVLTANAFDEQITESFRAAAASGTVTVPMNLCITGPARLALWARPDAATATSVYASFGFYEL